jgi:hypothetical protein
VVASHSNIKKSLAKVPAEVKVHSDVERRCILIPVVVEALAKLPACLPRSLMGVGDPRTSEYSDAMDGAQVGKRVAQGPAFLEGAS